MTASEALEALDHGGRLALALHGPEASPAQILWCLIQDAIAAVDSLPDQDRRWLKSGFRSGGWANIVNTKWDVALVERLRLMSAMKPTDDGEPKTQPQRREIDRALDVLEWLRWCLPARQGPELVRAAVALARGADSASVMRLYSPQTPGREPRSRRRQLAYTIKNRVATALLRGLRDTYGIAPGTDAEGLTLFRLETRR